MNVREDSGDSSFIVHRSSFSLHSGAWLTWLGAAIVALSLTRNPFYLALLLLCIAAVSRALRSRTETPALPLPLLRLALFIVALSALFNAATAHFGQTVLFTLPAGIPLLGGPVTLEALVFGAINGLVLVGFLAAFNVLYQALPTHALIRMIPRALFPVAVVVSIAISFVPATLEQFYQIRDAQRMRGHQVRGLRDGLPLLMPLLVGGLERALQLAEAMTARGYGSLGAQVSQAAAQRVRLTLALGLVLLLAGLLALLFWQQPMAGWALIIAGGGLLLTALVWQGRGIQRTTYRRQAWRSWDWLIAGASLLVLVAYVLPASRLTLAYTPYPRLSMPGFELWLAVATLALLAPALWLQRRLWLKPQVDPAKAS
ncbi:MAG: energy-coupling factor transporter transmembrane component T [Anaerolineae bacterium]